MPNIFKPSSNTAAKLSLILGGALPVALLYAGSSISRSPSNTSVGVGIDQPVFFSHKHHAIELGIDCRFCHVSVEESKHATVPPTETCMTCHSQIWTNSPLLEPVRKSWELGKPLVWNKVNKLPEFVYFDHSIHIARGISCNACHGPIQNMQMTFKGHDLSMAWCLECHREPEKYIRELVPGVSPQQQVFEFYKKLQTTGTHDMGHEDFGLLEGNGRFENKELVEKGQELLEKFKVNKKQLMDCWICHR